MTSFIIFVAAVAIVMAGVFLLAAYDGVMGAESRSLVKLLALIMWLREERVKISEKTWSKHIHFDRYVGIYKFYF